MLTNQAFDEYCASHSLSMEAIEYIRRVRSSEPSRMVGVNAKENAVSFVPSEKMGHTISTESRGPERAYFLLSEYDENVLEIWEQPSPVSIVRMDAKGRIISRWYTPDFLVLTNNGPKVVEVKAKEQISTLVKRYPSDWIDKNGHIDYLPARDFYSNLGLQFIVFVYTNELRYWISNLEMMIWSRGYTEVDGAISLDEIFEQSFAWSLFDIKKKFQLPSYTGLVKLLDQRKLFFDMHNALISEPKNCVVVRDSRLIEEANSLINLHKMLNPLAQSSVNFEKVPNEFYAKKVLDRLAAIERGDSNRSVRRWKALIRNGESIGNTPFQSLISKKYLSGNRTRRVPQKVADFLRTSALGYIGKPGMSIYGSYNEYCVDAKDFHPGLPPVCWETFRATVKRIPADKLAGARAGKRAANKVAAPTDNAERLLKADLPWRMAAIDHYNADIYLVYFSDDGVVWVMRPWVTAMVDVFSGDVLAFAVSFQPPSRKSVCKVLRDCVRRHGKLPAEIIVDRGSEFKSVYFAAFLAHVRCILTLRPSAHPRYGAEVEGLFGQFKKQWLSKRKGNLADYKEARATDGKFHPKKSAVLTPFDFYRELEEYFSWRSHRPVGMSSESNFDKFSIKSSEFPFVGNYIEFDDEFILASAVDSNDFTIDFARGIHIGDLFYWSPALSSLQGRRSKTEVRLDPENPHVVYARVDNKWEVCRSSKANRFSALDPISQKIEMLLVVESKNNKKIIAKEADEALVRKIRSMNTLSENRSPGLLEISTNTDSEPSQSDDIFSAILAASIVPLAIEGW